MTKKLIESQEKYNNSLINLMCLTFDKEKMKYYIDAYIMSNKVTNDIIALKNEMDSKSKEEEKVEAFGMTFNSKRECLKYINREINNRNK